MPSININRRNWENYDWNKRGEEWSESWGSTEHLWYGTILPRINKLVPAPVILEIAPGGGRCTQYLLNLTEKLIVVDISEKCINTCKERFKFFSNIEYYVNDGKSLGMLQDNSIDFVFSWESMIHVESDALYSYFQYISQKLKPGGRGFIHHSNIGAYKNQKAGKLLVTNHYWRAESVSAKLVRQFCHELGLTCISQEMVNWKERILNDCFTVIEKTATAPENITEIVENREFMNELNHLKLMYDLYGLPYNNVNR
jgi:2-polyprenyl-3-methyl-5-hydroxy-6-metoxy-1,4-benzoquinol methylase